MMLQILFNHFFRHLPNCGAEISPCPKMSSPISLLQMWKLLEQSTCRIAFDPPHNLTGCHSGRSTHQNMHMILANYTAHDPFHKLDEPLLELVQQHPLSKSYSGISSPKQNDTQFEKPYDCHTCSP